MFQLRPQAASDTVAIQSLLDLAFGADRLQRPSYALRSGSPISELAWVAEADGVLVGTINYWPVVVRETPGLLLGPLGVHPGRRGEGIGRALMRHSLAVVDTTMPRFVALVGDLAYYADFEFAVAPATLRLKGAQPSRFLVRKSFGEALPKGVLEPAGNAIESTADDRIERQPSLVSSE